MLPLPLITLATRASSPVSRRAAHAREDAQPRARCLRLFELESDPAHVERTGRGVVVLSPDHCAERGPRTGSDAWGLVRLAIALHRRDVGRAAANIQGLSCFAAGERGVLTVTRPARRTRAVAHAGAEAYATRTRVAPASNDALGVATPRRETRAARLRSNAPRILRSGS